MNNKDLINAMEQVLMGQMDEFPFDSLVEKVDSLSQYQINTLKRLYRIWNQRKSSDYPEAYDLDLAISLRDYLIVFDTSLAADLIPIQEDILEKAGLILNSDDERLYGTYRIPTEVNREFVESVFRPQLLSNNQLKSDLITNRMIYTLTGFKSFRSIEQKLSVLGALRAPVGATVLISLPTGSGKSLITQILAFANDKPQLTIVVVPTISLAIDQCRAARKNLKISDPEKSIQYYTSGSLTTLSDVSEGIRNKTLRLLFLSPESLIKNKIFQSEIEGAAKSKYLANYIIDEAHLIRDWGASFRVDFMNLSLLDHRLAQKNPNLKTILLSATYDERTDKTLQILFQTKKRPWIEFRFDSFRHEPRYLYLPCSSEIEKQKKLSDLILTLPHPMIVYVDSPDQAEELKLSLNDIGLNNIRTFTGQTNTSSRKRIIDEWIDDQFSIMVATSAFGVGVDKPDVRSVIHAYLPQNASAYYQELGRGGRDGLPSLSAMILNPSVDLRSASARKAQSVLSEDKLRDRWISMFQKNAVLQKSSYEIDASIIPNYDSDEENGLFEPLLEEGLSYGQKVSQIRHTGWNINVLYLLYLYGAIAIEELHYQNEKYTFLVQILDDRLRDSGNELLQLLREIRNREIKQNDVEFRLMKSILDNYQNECWSEMFYETFPLADHYCAGCSSHSNIDQSVQTCLIKQRIDTPVKTIDFRGLLKNSTEALLYLPQLDKELLQSVIKKLNVSTLILSSEYLEKWEAGLLSLTSPDDFLILSMKTYLQLLEEGNYFFTSGVVLTVYSSELKSADQEYRQMMKRIDYILKKRNDHYIIHGIAEDFLVSSSEKFISEIVNGPQFQETLFQSDGSNE